MERRQEPPPSSSLRLPAFFSCLFLRNSGLPGACDDAPERGVEPPCPPPPAQNPAVVFRGYHLLLLHLYILCFLLLAD